MFLSEDGFEVVRVNCGIASIPPFRIDIPSSSESIQFGAKTTRTEPDDKIELGKILKPLCLPLGQHLGSRKILKVFMIYNNVDGISWTFQVVSPNLESFQDGKQFLAIHIVVQPYHSESTRVKSHQMNFIFFINNRKDCSESIVQSISFHNELSIRNPMSKDRGRCECFFKRVEIIMTGGVKLPRNVLLDKAVKFTNSGLSFSLFYFSFLFSFCFIFLFSIFGTTRVRVDQ